MFVVADLSLLREDEFDDRCCGEDVPYQFQQKHAFVELSAEQHPLLSHERLRQLLGVAGPSGTPSAPIDLTSSSLSTSLASARIGTSSTFMDLTTTSSTSLGGSHACVSSELFSMDSPRLLVRLWVEEIESDAMPFPLVRSRTALLDVGAELAAASFTLPLSALARYLPDNARRNLKCD